MATTPGLGVREGFLEEVDTVKTDRHSGVGYVRRRSEYFRQGNKMCKVLEE